MNLAKKKKNEPDVYHRTLGADRKSAADSARTREELDAKYWKVEHVMHDSSVQEPDNFRYTGATCWKRDELQQRKQNVTRLINRFRGKKTASSYFINGQRHFTR